MEAFVVKGYVDVDNVAFFKGPGIRNAMANDLVDRSAVRLGEVVVI